MSYTTKIQKGNVNVFVAAGDAVVVSPYQGFFGQGHSRKSGVIEDFNTRHGRSGASWSGSVISLEDALHKVLLDRIKESGLSNRFYANIERISSLEDGWDGENAQKPHFDILQQAVSLVLELRKDFPVFAEPFISPIPDGTVQLDWETEKRRLEVEVRESKLLVIGSEIRDSHVQIYHEGEFALSNSTMLERCFSWWYRFSRNWPKHD